MPHENYPVDIQIDGDRDIFLDPTGDLATVGRHPNLEQSVAILVSNVTQQLVGSTVDGDTLGLLEQRVREALNRDIQVDDILEVDVTTFDRDAGKITMDVRTTENHEYTVEVPT